MPSLIFERMCDPCLHVQRVEAGSPVLYHPVPPLVRVDPEVMEGPSEELQLFSVQLGELAIVGLETGVDPALRKVLEERLLIIRCHGRADGDRQATKLQRNERR